MHDRGASARDKGGKVGSAWPPTIASNMVIARLHFLLVAFVSF